MSHPAPTPASVVSPPNWTDPQRQQAFETWLQQQTLAHSLDPRSVRAASADASFRRYFRVDSAHGTRIIMDAPPEKENCEPFVRIAGLMRDAGLLVPRILAWDAAQGFMLLDDLGQHTMMEVIDPRAAPPLALYQRALDALLPWQTASRPGVLPAYDEALLRRELELFPEWYLGHHRGLTLTDATRNTLNTCFERIIAHNLRGPSVFVHRDFMPRNLMMPAQADEPRLGVLDFQDAVYGPVTYDVASLMRDAFLSWDEDFVLDVTVRYWERAREVVPADSPDAPELDRAIAEARDKGDLSENAEYDAAKEAQGILEMKISKMETIIANARLIDETHMDNSKVFILSKVLIKNKTNGMEIEYTLVAENEADIKLRKISIESPIGKGLLGKKVGDIAEIQTPGGIMHFEIISISR